MIQSQLIPLSYIIVRELLGVGSIYRQCWPHQIRWHFHWTNRKKKNSIFSTSVCVSRWSDAMAIHHFRILSECQMWIFRQNAKNSCNRLVFPDPTHIGTVENCHSSGEVDCIRLSPTEENKTSFKTFELIFMFYNAIFHLYSSQVVLSK